MLACDSHKKTLVAVLENGITVEDDFAQQRNRTLRSSPLGQKTNAPPPSTCHPRTLVGSGITSDTSRFQQTRGFQ